jgi:uncharacterized protein (DUF1499 family)
MIHDVSTDTDDPPAFVALRDTRMRYRNGIDYSGGKQRHPGIAPQIYKQPRAQIFQAALAAANAMQWHIAAAVEPEGRIEATATTRIMRFKDDVVIRIRNHGAHNGGTRLDIRSASRVGSSDFGANARRIRAFLNELNNRLKTNT